MTDSDPGVRRGPVVPRLEIDELLGQLVARAEDVLVTQSRLRGLLEANLSINGGLSLPDVLRRIVTAVAACPVPATARSGSWIRGAA